MHAGFTKVTVIQRSDGQFGGLLSATVARAPNPMSNSPSPASTTTDLFSCAFARPRPGPIVIAPSSAGVFGAMGQPMIFREYKSKITASYNQPLRVRM